MSIQERAVVATEPDKAEPAMNEPAGTRRQRFLSYAAAAEAARRGLRLAEAIAVAEAAEACWPRPVGLLGHVGRRLALGQAPARLAASVEAWREIRAANAAPLREALDGLAAALADWTAYRAIEGAERELLALGRRDLDDDLVEGLWRCADWRARSVTATRALAEAEAQEGGRFFIRAEAAYARALACFPDARLEARRAACALRTDEEGAFEGALVEAEALLGRGHPRRAIHLLECALREFERRDGEAALSRARSRLAAQEAFGLGLEAERRGDWAAAAAHYHAAVRATRTDEGGPGEDATPPASGDPTSPGLRLGTVLARAGRHGEAETAVEGQPGAAAACVRAVALAGQGRHHEASAALAGVATPEAERLRPAIAAQHARRRAATQARLTSLVDADRLEEARDLSQTSLARDPEDALVRSNLDEHLLPRIARVAWEEASPAARRRLADEAFQRKPELPALHNWAIAALADAEAGAEDWIAPGLTLLANLAHHPAAPTPEERDRLSRLLRQRLEERLDALRGVNPDDYRAARDRWRRDEAAIVRFDTHPEVPPRIGELVLTPGLRDALPETPLPDPTGDKEARLLAELYGPLGDALAAWLGGDQASAERLAGAAGGQGGALAAACLAYGHGLARLREHDWRGARAPLAEARDEIRKDPEWSEAISERMRALSRGVRPEADRVAFGMAWAEVLGTPEALRFRVTAEADLLVAKLTPVEGREQELRRGLEALLPEDPGNPAVIEYQRRLGVHLELQRISSAIDRGNFEDGVRRALQSPQPEVRARIAEVCVKILLDAAGRGRLNPAEGKQLLDWAIALCPEREDYKLLMRKLRGW